LSAKAGLNAAFIARSSILQLRHLPCRPGNLCFRSKAKSRYLAPISSVFGEQRSVIAVAREARGVAIEKT
jgi:hypothetical protein